MKPIEVLIQLSLLCWNTLFLGWKNGWASKKDIINYAVSLLSEEKDENNETVSVIAGGDYLEDEELQTLVSELVNDVKGDALDKWRLAHLICISEMSGTEQEKIDQLQEIYAKFDYPEDMSSCSIYAKDEIDPLAAMMQVTNNLRQKFGVN